MYCVSEPQKGPYKAWIRPRESRGRDTWAAALKEFCTDSTFDQSGFCSCDVLLLSSHYVWLLVMVTSLIHLINYLLLPDL